ncbi:MAG TPA: precorrin-3B C(17)-methyltransferase [Clostridiaceae bacterium]|nr:precorrin-3B C(17)-methyltransferase [Clostridiaceae bacterium]
MGLLFVVGIGPGHTDGLTIEAKKALLASEVIIGYKGYIELVESWFDDDKQLLSTPMGSEVERCHLALRAARTKTVSMICSGDAGVYGMAGLILQLAPDYPDVKDIEIIPGVSAAMSGAALLGSPLTNDFCVISLSDLLTPWDLIEKRLRAAGMGDFVICLYNPGSRKRSTHLARACAILLNYRKASTVCGLARQIGRENEGYELVTLSQLRDLSVDMFTTVFIGNSDTEVINNKMVTVRGYKDV